MIPLLSLLPGVLKTIGRVTGLDIATQAADAISGLSVSPEKQAELDKAMLEHEEKMETLSVEKLKQTISAITVEAQSNDAYVRRARPTFLYLMYIILILNYGVTSLVHLFNATVVPVDLPPDLLLLFGSGYLGYSYLRTRDKENEAK